MSLRGGSWRSCLRVAVTLRFEVGDRQRVGTLSGSGKAATPHFETVISAVKVAGLGYREWARSQAREKPRLPISKRWFLPLKWQVYSEWERSQAREKPWLPILKRWFLPLKWQVYSEWARSQAREKPRLPISKRWFLPLKWQVYREWARSQIWENSSYISGKLCLMSDVINAP